MRAPLSWLKEHVEIRLPIEELAEKLTLAGLEVKAIERLGEWWDPEKIVVGQIVRVDPHPNADRLTLPVVDYGAGHTIQVVTGAPNIKIGESGAKVALALTGARLIDGHSDERRWITLKPSRIRGVASEGMVCSEKELDLSPEHEGIMILPVDAPVGMPLAKYLGDIVLDIELTPNLARCLSIVGIAREIAALTGVASHIPDPRMWPQGQDAADQVNIEIDDPDLCSRYVGAIVRGVTIQPSPFFMQRRLQMCGVRPINNLVDITNYVMLEWGQPLHAFDYDLLRGPSGKTAPHDIPLIRVRRARAGEAMTTLDGQQRQLTEDMLLITDGGGPVAVAGIMGGLNSEIGPNTKNVLLEAASFDMINNRQSSQQLHLSSEASYRFGRGVPPSLAPIAVQRAAELMRVLGGGTIQAGLVDANPVPYEPVTVPMDPDRVRHVLGLDVSDDEIDGLLTALHFAVDRTVTPWQVLVPDHRLDVSIEADLIEDVARVYGYDRLPTSRMRDTLPPAHDDRISRGEDQLRNLLASAGLQEVITYSIVDWRVEQPLRANGAGDGSDYVKILNPLTTDRQWLRRLVLPGVLASARDNARQTDGVRLYEVGRVFEPIPGEDLPNEPTHVAAVFMGTTRETHWSASGHYRDLDFFDAKGALEYVAESLGVTLTYQAVVREGMHPGRTASVTLDDGKAIGFIGELHPAVRSFYHLPELPVVVCELEVEPLLARWEERTKLVPVSRFPPVIQDMAVVLDADVPASTAEDEIRQAGGSLLTSVRLFDVYSGAPIAEDERGLAFRLVYSALDRTPTEEEVRRTHARIARRLQERLGARLRE